ncbi:MAG: hypothetical protein ACXADU_05965 [Promethearchaeota archaeon]|jgi:hypothetical protein
MKTKSGADMEYYEFLHIIQKISQNSQSIQKEVISQVFANYDTCRFLNELDRHLEQIDGLLSRLELKQ